MDLILDVNIQIYPVDLGEFTVCTIPLYLIPVVRVTSSLWCNMRGKWDRRGRIRSETKEYNVINRAEIPDPLRIVSLIMSMIHPHTDTRGCSEPIVFEVVLNAGRRK